MPHCEKSNPLVGAHGFQILLLWLTTPLSKTPIPFASRSFQSSELSVEWRKTTIRSLREGQKNSGRVLNLDRVPLNLTLAESVMWPWTWSSDSVRQVSAYTLMCCKQACILQLGMSAICLKILGSIAEEMWAHFNLQDLGAKRRSNLLLRAVEVLVFVNKMIEIEWNLQKIKDVQHRYSLKNSSLFLTSFHF